MGIDNRDFRLKSMPLASTMIECFNRSQRQERGVRLLLADDKVLSMRRERLGPTRDVVISVVIYLKPSLLCFPLYRSMTHLISGLVV